MTIWCSQFSHTDTLTLLLGRAHHRHHHGRQTLSFRGKGCIQESQVRRAPHRWRQTRRDARSDQVLPTRRSSKTHQFHPFPSLLFHSPTDHTLRTLKELLAESNAHKADANALFNSASYADALARYADAIAACPTYLAFELAVLHSNASACHLKLEDWKEAIASATRSLDALDVLGRDLAKEEQEEEERERTRQDNKDDVVEEEIVSAGAATAAPAPAPSSPADEARARKQADVARIRYKALMRRARARSEAGGWSDLAGAEEDYKTLSKMDNVGAGDRRIVAAQLRALPPRVKAAQERETAEMWGKLKEVSLLTGGLFLSQVTSLHPCFEFCFFLARNV